MKGLVAGVLISVGLVTSAHATIKFTDGWQLDSGNNLSFTNREIGTTVFADVEGGLTDAVRFNGTEELKETFSYERTGVRARDKTLNSLEFSLVQPNTGFDAAQFQLRANKFAPGGAVTLTAFDQFGKSFSRAIDLAPRGLNRFTIEALDNQLITRVLIAGADGVQFGDVSGFKLADIMTYTPNNPAPVPGPIAGAGLPALMALGGFVWARRRKAATA